MAGAEQQVGSRVTQWVGLGLVLGLVALCVYLGLRLRGAQEVARGAERQALTAQGFLVQAEERERAVGRERDALAAESASFRALLAAAQARLQVRTAEVVRLETAVASVPGGSARPGVAPPQCSLAPGDRGKVLLLEAKLQTNAGNEVVVALGQCWRTWPLPEALVLEAPVVALASRDVRSTDVAQPGGRGLPWGLGPMGGWAPGGWVVGLSYVTPSLDILGLTTELVVSAGGGPAGALVMASAPLRR